MVVIITLDKAIEGFMIDQKLRGNTDNTICTYKRILGYFTAYLGGETMVGDISLMDIKKYQLFLIDKNRDFNIKTNLKVKLSKTTIQSYIRHIRVFMNWIHDEGYIEDKIGSRIKLPKAPKKTVEILSNEEIELLYKSINERTEFGLRNKCIISLMLDSGLRRNEAITLDIQNIHFTQNVIKVFGKGEKERIVPMGLYTKKLLYKYLNGYRPMPEYLTDKVFISQDKSPVSVDVVKMLFYRLKRKTGIKRLSPHLLRHTFATLYLINGGDAFSLQQILGHTSLEMTRRYSHIASSYTVKNFKKLSTLDRLKGQNMKL